MKTSKEIKGIIAKHKEMLRERYKVKDIGVFGSYVRNEQKDKSDVDILVEFFNPVSLLHIISVENYLSDIIGIKVDVFSKKNIREELKDIILKEVIPL